MAAYDVEVAGKQVVVPLVLAVRQVVWIHTERKDAYEKRTLYVYDTGFGRSNCDGRYRTIITENLRCQDRKSYYSSGKGYRDWQSDR